MKMPTSPPQTRKKILLQTSVDPNVARRFDMIAKTRGHKRAAYLRFVVERLCKETRLAMEERRT